MWSNFVELILCVRLHETTKNLITNPLLTFSSLYKRWFEPSTLWGEDLEHKSLFSCNLQYNSNEVSLNFIKYFVMLLFFLKNKKYINKFSHQEKILELVRNERNHTKVTPYLKTNQLSLFLHEVGEKKNTRTILQSTFLGHTLKQITMTEKLWNSENKTKLKTLL